MQYLNDWDKNIPNLDVVDDYRTETKQIRAIRGNSVQFSFGDVSSIGHQITIIYFFFFLVHSKNSDGWY